MDRAAFYGQVEQRANLADDADARDATRAVLESLGERLPGDQNRRLSGELPSDLGDHLTENESDRRVSYEEFVARVGERTARADASDPEGLSRAVVATVLECADEEGDELRENLERYGYEPLLEA